MHYKPDQKMKKIFIYSLLLLICCGCSATTQETNAHVLAQGILYGILYAGTGGAICVGIVLFLALLINKGGCIGFIIAAGLFFALLVCLGPCADVP